MANKFVPKELILTCEPFVRVLTCGTRDLRCEYCFESCPGAQRCSGCRVVRYCGKKCQKKSWSFHKLECQCFKAVAPKIPMDVVRLMLRLALKYTANEFTKLDSAKMRTFEGLKDHMTEVKADKKRMAQFIEVLGTYNIFTKKLAYIGLPSEKILFEIFCRLLINGFTISDCEMQPIGVGVYLSGSIFDHSCDPNADALFNGTTLEIRAVREIPGRDISKVRIYYIDLLSSREERQSKLQEQYYFTCDCSRCSDNQLDELMHSTRCPNTSCDEAILANCEECPRCHCTEFSQAYWDEKEEVEYRCKSVLEDIKKKKESEAEIYARVKPTLSEVSSILHPMNIFMVRLNDKAFNACISLEKWEEGVEYGTKTLDPYRKYLPGQHQVKGIQLMKMGKLQQYLNNWKSALGFFQEAETILSLPTTLPKYAGTDCYLGGGDENGHGTQ